MVQRRAARCPLAPVGGAPCAGVRFTTARSRGDRRASRTGVPRWGARGRKIGRFPEGDGEASSYVRPGGRATSRTEETTMPRYLVERTFADGLQFPVDRTGARLSTEIIGGNETYGVTWVHSYVSDDDRATWCVYDAAEPRDGPGGSRPQGPARGSHHPSQGPRPVLLRRCVVNRRTERPASLAALAAGSVAVPLGEAT